MPIYGAALMGGGSGPAFAAIGAIYPVGAVCTCSYNGQTLTAKDTSGRALFLVPSAGQWLVKATNGGREVEDTVSITTKGQVASVTLAFFTATIAVTYPSGSTCTCSDGSTTLTAPDTSGSYTFTVPNTGTWTVTATDGSSSKSETVSIASDGETAQVSLAYALEIFTEGKGFSEGFSAQKAGSATVSDAKIWCQNEEPSDEGRVLISPAIDLSSYNTLNVEARLGRSYGTFGISSSATVQSTSFVASKKGDSTKRKTYSLDISSLQQTGYIRLHANGNINGGEWYRIWLE